MTAIHFSIKTKDFSNHMPKVDSNRFRIISLFAISIILFISVMALAGLILPSSLSSLSYTFHWLIAEVTVFTLAISILGLLTSFLGMYKEFLATRMQKAWTEDNIKKLSEVHSNNRFSSNLRNGFKGTDIAWVTEPNLCYRHSMEDTHIGISFPISGVFGKEEVFLAGIFDGHGGSEVAIFLERNIQTYLTKEFNKLPNLESKNIECAIKSTFFDLDTMIRTKCPLFSGSCASIVLIIHHVLYAANLGDSRIVLSQNGTCIDLSHDAKATGDCAHEIIKKGGWITNEKVNGQLAVTTSFGDWNLAYAHDGSKLISSIPEITNIEMSKIHKGDFLIVACDGLWDVLESEEAVLIARKSHSKELAANSLLQEALKRKTTDNLSIGVLFF